MSTSHMIELLKYRCATWSNCSNVERQNVELGALFLKPLGGSNQTKTQRLKTVVQKYSVADP
jgi:hypothetical protein